MMHLSCNLHTLITGLVIKSLTPQPGGDPLQLAVMEEDSGMLDIGDESDGVMESIQYEEEGEGEGEGEEEGWFIDSRLLQKDFIAKQYSLALFTYKKVSWNVSQPCTLCVLNAKGRIDILLINNLHDCIYCVWKAGPNLRKLRNFSSS